MFDLDKNILKDGEPCNHPGCLNHVSHPCEGCGRIAGKIIGENYMFNEEERKKELIEITYLLSFFKDRYEKAIDLIISQEKSMIEQAKKEAREEMKKELGI